MRKISMLLGLVLLLLVAVFALEIDSVDCYDILDMTHRIECRLANNYSSFPFEQCRAFEDRSVCTIMMNKSVACHNELQMLGCFANVTTFVPFTLEADNMFYTPRVSSLELYQLFVLHYFETQVIEAFNQTVFESDAVTLLTQIVMTGELIATQAPQSQIQSQLTDFERTWRFYFS